MLPAAITFANLLLGALTAGAMFGMWLAMNPASLSAPLFVTQHQHFVRAVNGVMPPLGGLTIVLTIVAAVLARHDGPRLGLFCAATACFVAAGLITRLANQPINAIIMGWTPQAPPVGWEVLRDRWWHWHAARTVAGLAGLCALLAASIRQP
jgi:hypothetical protein